MCISINLVLQNLVAFYPEKMHAPFKNIFHEANVII